MLAVRALDTSPTTLSHAGSESSQLSNVWWIMFALAIVVYLVATAIGTVLVGALLWRLVRPEGRRRRRRVA